MGSAFIMPSSRGRVDSIYQKNAPFVTRKEVSKALYLDAAGGIDVMDSISHAWESYNMALEQDPLITK